MRRCENKLDVDKNVTFSVVNVDLSLHGVHKRFAVLAQCGGKTSTAEHPHLLKNYNHFFSFS